MIARIERDATIEPCRAGHRARHHEDVPYVQRLDGLGGLMPPAHTLEGLVALQADDLRLRVENDVGTLLDPADQIPGHRLREAVRPHEDVLLASRDGREASLRISQDVDLWLALLEDGERRELKLAPGRHAWVHVARGSVDLDEQTLGERDGAAVSGAAAVRLAGKGPAEVLVFDLG